MFVRLSHMVRDGRPAGSSLRRFVVVAIAVLPLVTARSTRASEVSDAEAASATVSSRSVSLWDRPVPGTDITYAELTIEGKSAADIEPVLLPLPAPAVAAGVGLGIAWVVRRRFARR